jgi:hypothetical protein
MISKFVTILRYKPPGSPQNDLALLKLRKDLEFSKKIMPVCLPQSLKFPDYKGYTYVAGWGSVHEVACTTDGQGAAPFSRCKFPFNFYDVPFSRCAYTPSPSSKGKYCNALIKQLKKEIPVKGYSQVLFIIRPCFSIQLPNFLNAIV